MIYRNDHKECLKLLKKVGVNRWVAGVQSMNNKILEKLHGRKPLAVFHTDCAARGKKTFDVIEKDHFVASMKNPITQDDKSIPWLGMYGFGEFAKIGDSNLFSTQTSSLCVLVNKD